MASLCSRSRTVRAIISRWPCIDRSMCMIGSGMSSRQGTFCATPAGLLAGALAISPCACVPPITAGASGKGVHAFAATGADILGGVHAEAVAATHGSRNPPGAQLPQRPGLPTALLMRLVLPLRDCLRWPLLRDTAPVLEERSCDTGVRGAGRRTGMSAAIGTDPLPHGSGPWLLQLQIRTKPSRPPEMKPLPEGANVHATGGCSWPRALYSSRPSRRSQICSNSSSAADRR